MPKGLKLIETLCPQLSALKFHDETSYFHDLLKKHKVWTIYKLTKAHPRTFGYEYDPEPLTDDEYIAAFLFTIICGDSQTEVEIKQSWGEWKDAKTRFDNSMENLQRVIEAVESIKAKLGLSEVFEKNDPSNEGPSLVDNSFWPGKKNA